MNLQASISAVLTNAQGHQRYSGWTSVHYYYDRYRVIVPQSAYYTFTSAGGPLDAFGYFYSTVFSPNNSVGNLIGMDRNSSGTNQFKIHIALLSNFTYELVVTTFNPNRTGNYTINVYGLYPVNIQKINDSTTTTTATTAATTTTTATTTATATAMTGSQNTSKEFSSSIHETMIFLCRFVF